MIVGIEAYRLLKGAAAHVQIRRVVIDQRHPLEGAVVIRKPVHLHLLIGERLPDHWDRRVIVLPFDERRSRLFIWSLLRPYQAKSTRDENYASDEKKAQRSERPKVAMKELRKNALKHFW